ncbi:SHOCT domain-containing protein [Methylorubrum thiocyanatum]
MIEKLGGLRDRGLLTEFEFEAKKAEIMARI